MISVIMSVYNENISDLERSISSVLNQTFSNFEFLIICDNPKASEIHEYLLDKSRRDSRIRLIFNDENLRQNKSRNKAVANAKNEYIVIMDADDVMHIDRLKQQYDFFAYYKLDLCFTNVSIIDNNDNITRKNIFSNYNIVDQKKMKHVLKSHSIALGPTFMFRKSIFKSLNGYREMNVEDYDLVTRFLVNNNKVGYIGKSLVYKRLRNDSISFGSLYEQYIIMKSISCYSKKNNFNSTIPLSYINDQLKNINDKQLSSYKRYSKIRYKFNDNRNIKTFIQLLLSIILSKTVISHSIWVLKNRVFEKIH